MNLTKLEARLLAEIKAHPFASQKEVGEALGISRASVANYIDRLQNKGLILGRAYIFAQSSGIACIGGTVLDRILRMESPAITATSQPGSSSETRGGVCRNVAENLAQLGEDVKLISIVGADDAGRNILEATQSAGVDISLVEKSAQGVTGTYTAIMQPSGDLYLGVADMGIMAGLDMQFLDRYWQHIITSRLVFVETNCTPELLLALLNRCRSADLPLAIDAVSVPKFKRLPQDLTGVTYLFCNLDEARALLELDDPQDLCRALAVRGVQNIIITSGGDPVYCFSPELFSVIETPKTEIVDVSGAGDAFVAGTLHAILQEKPLVEAAKYGVVAASLTVKSHMRNSPDLNAEALETGAAEITKG